MAFIKIERIWCLHSPPPPTTLKLTFSQCLINPWECIIVSGGGPQHYSADGHVIYLNL